jgi:hypothetical protein
VLICPVSINVPAMVSICQDRLSIY